LGLSAIPSTLKEEAVTDGVEISRRIERLVARVERRDDYGTLLASGKVIVGASTLDDSKEWRAAIRRRARADRIKVRTGESEGSVWALLHEGGTQARQAESRRYAELLWRTVVPRAVEHRHELLVLLRDGEEALFACRRCEALGYVDAAAGPLLGGPLLKEDCPHEDPPEPTMLSLSAGRG
jgi:hypothetical protein